MNYPQQDNTDDETLGEKLALVLPYLNERQQRLLLADEACFDASSLLDKKRAISGLTCSSI